MTRYQWEFAKLTKAQKTLMFKAEECSTYQRGREKAGMCVAVRRQECRTARALEEKGYGLTFTLCPHPHLFFQLHKFNTDSPES